MTTATTWRKERGRETERLLAAWFRDHGWPYAEPVGAGRPGADITGMPGLAPEAKAVSSCIPATWIKQARDERRPGLAFTIWRGDGYGPATIDRWAVIVDLETFTALLKAAGYGDDHDTA